MLINTFYKKKHVVLLKENTIKATIKLNKNHDVFLGHFPNNPVAPGVCMLQIIKEITQDFLNCSLTLKQISNLKFTAIINPEVNSNLILETTISSDTRLIKIKNITKFIDGTIALKYNGTYIKN